MTDGPVGGREASSPVRRMAVHGDRAHDRPMASASIPAAPPRRRETSHAGWWRVVGLAVLVPLLLAAPVARPRAGAAPVRPAAVAAPTAAAATGTAVMRTTRVDAAAIVAWFQARSPGGYQATVPIAELVAIFLDEGAAQGIAPDIAFAQSVLETGWFTFPGTGQVRPEDNNFSGLGAVDDGSGATVAKFPTARLGVRAQVQHLWAYADPTATAAAVARPPVVDPRFDLVVPKGKAPHWELMGAGNWATDPDYGAKVLALYNDLLDFHGVRLRRWATLFFQDVTGRAPTSDEVTSWATLALVRGREVAAHALTTTFSASMRTVHGLYWLVLGRTSDAGGRTYYAELVRSGWTYPDVVAALATSSEFVRKAGPTTADYVRALYLRLLGRPADGSGLAHWTAAIDAGTPRATLVRTLHGSTEARRRRVRLRYTTLLRRPADRAGLATYVPALALVDERWLDGSLGASAEYFTLAQA